MVRLRYLTLIGFSVAVLAAPTASGQEADSTLAEGFAIEEDSLTLYRFRLSTEDWLLIENLGQLDRAPNPTGGFQNLPDTSLSQLRLPFTTLKLIMGQAADARSDTVVSRFGYSIESERLRLQFDRGIPVWLAIALTLGLLTAGGSVTAILLTRRQQQRAVEEEATRQRTFHAREAERSRLAREIHDGPLQDIHALRLLTGVHAADVVEVEAGRIARDLRAIAEGLRPPALGRFGLAAALSAHTRRIKERHPDIQFDLDLEEKGVGPDSMPEIIRAALFRIAQEAITNAIEHGDADRIQLRLQFSEDDHVTLTISDDGSGLPADVLDLESLADGGHFGLIGMHERADALGGRLTLTPDGLNGRGVRVQVTTPTVSSAKTKPTRRRLLSA